MMAVENTLTVAGKDIGERGRERKGEREWERERQIDREKERLINRERKRGRKRLNFFLFHKH